MNQNELTEKIESLIARLDECTRALLSKDELNDIILKIRELRINIELLNHTMKDSEMVRKLMETKHG
jgi:hypothetical protein